MRAFILLVAALTLVSQAAPVHAQAKNSPSPSQSQSVQSQSGQGLSEAQKQEIDALIGDYLRAHPEVILDSVRAMQERDQAAQQQRQKDDLVARRDDIEKDPSSPVIGNPNGNVTLVEFFDYRCGYCKGVFPSLLRLLKEDGNVRYVMKELPILTPESRIAAKVALTVWKNEPTRYQELHTKLMSAQGDLPEKRIFEIAKSAGVDIDRVKRDMNAPDIEQTIDANLQLAQTLGITGTPGFVIGNRLLPGAVDYETLKQVVAEARKGA
jgi:protein-disulfide isomerase